MLLYFKSYFIITSEPSPISIILNTPKMRKLYLLTEFLLEALSEDFGY
jgi:hypothetical protein